MSDRIDDLIREGQAAAPAADGSLTRRLTDALVHLRGRIKRREDVLEHMAARKALEIERDAMTAVARRLRDGWTPETGASLLEFFTPAERAALDALDADDESE